MADAPSPAKALINRETSISVAVVIAIVLGAVGWARWDSSFKTRIELQLTLMNQQLGKIETSSTDAITSIRADLSALKQQVDRGTADRWTRSDMLRWSSELRKRNASTDVPDVLPEVVKP